MGFVKIFPNLEATGLGVFNEKFTQSERALPQEKVSRFLIGVCSRKMLAMRKLPDIRGLSCRKNYYDANGAIRVALRAVAKPGLAIEL